MLLINLILVIVVSAKHNVIDGLGTLQDGDCNETKRLDLWLHFLINILSTLLLGASNYSMQCLSAPTRKDVDSAHGQNTWMDIGVPSIRNVFRVSWPRKVLWCLLFLSSIPLHLMYNSVIFSSTSMSEWQGFAVTSDFLSGAPFSVNGTDRASNPLIPVGALTDRLGKLRNSTTLFYLDNKDCIAAYSEQIVSAWGDVLVFSAQPSTNNSFLNLMTPGPYSSDESTGGDLCDLGSGGSCNNDGPGAPNPDNWVLSAPGSPQVSHCMAEKASQHCKMRFSVPLMVAVIACNVAKVFCMGIIVWKLDPHPLVTLGDAIASFLDAPGA